MIDCLCLVFFPRRLAPGCLNINNVVILMNDARGSRESLHTWRPPPKLPLLFFLAVKPFFPEDVLRDTFSASPTLFLFLNVAPKHLLFIPECCCHDMFAKANHGTGIG